MGGLGAEASAGLDSKSCKAPGGVGVGSCEDL